MKSINSNTILIPLDSFPSWKETEYGTIMLVNGIAYEYIDIIEDILGSSNCLFERTKKAIEQQTIEAYKTFDEFDQALKKQIIKNINFVITEYGMSCNKIEYELPDSPHDPIQITAFIGYHNYREWLAFCEETKQAILEELLGSKYSVAFVA